MHDTEMKIIVQTSSSKPFVIWLEERSHPINISLKASLIIQDRKAESFNDFSSHSKQDNFFERDFLCRRTLQTRRKSSLLAKLIICLTSM